MAAAAVMAPMASLESTLPCSTDQAVPNSSPVNSSATNHASNLLIENMTAVLRDMGYDDTAIQTVSDRASANIVKATNYPAGDFLGGGDGLSHFIETELLNEQKLKAKNLYLNSNEPILLLEASQELHLEPTRVHSLKDDLLNILRGKGIKPVRVYIRQIDDPEQQPPHIGIVLLNVVNTDIGGPSMVQLLDAGFHGREWKEALVLKEGWNGEELLWRDEAWRGQEVVYETVSERRRLERTDAAAGALTGALAEEALPARADSSQYTDVNAVPGDEDEDDAEPEAIEHPAMKELREREAQRGEVQRPTWSQMEDDPGFLDIITTQSSSAKDTDPVSIIATQSVESLDDGYEVVEKV